MSVKRNGLGRNLSALLSHTDMSVLESPTTERVEQLNIAHACLQPGKYQPRGDMNEAGLAELAESIKKQGLLQPLVVREIDNGRYEIIAGERRWRACQLAGMTHIPVILRQVDDETAMAMALVENLQREDLNVMDQARAMQRLITEFELTHEQIANLLSKSRAAVSNYLRLLNLNAHVRHMLEQGDLDMGHARCLLGLEEDKQYQIAQWVVERQLSVRETEAIVARMRALAKEHTAKPPTLSPLFEEAVERLSKQLNTKVNIKSGSKGAGHLMIRFEDAQALELMMARLGQI